MAYIGPANSDQFKSMSTQAITGNGSATTFTLNTPVANSSEIRFVINNVVQKPDVNYTASGTQLSTCLLYTSPSPRDRTRSRMPSSA